MFTTEIRENNGRFHVYAMYGFALLRRDFATMPEAEANQERVANELRDMLAAAQG